MENLVAYCKPHESKPVSEKMKIWRKAYYETNKDKLLERAREHSKTRYHSDPEYKEKIRVKNENYRLVLKQAKQIVLQQSMEKEIQN
jgi:hypothetical protein